MVLVLQAFDNNGALQMWPCVRLGFVNQYTKLITVVFLLGKHIESYQPDTMAENFSYISSLGKKPQTTPHPIKYPQKTQTTPQNKIHSKR